MYSKITGFIDSLNEYLGASIDKEVRSPSDIDDTFYPDSASQYAMNFTLPNTTANVASGESFIVTLTKDDKNLSTPSHLVNTEFELTVTHNEEELSKTVTATFEPDISTFTVSYNIAESEGTVVQTGRPLEYDQDGDGNPDATFNSGSLCDGDLAGSSFNEDYIFNLSSCDSNGDCILTLYSPEEGSFPGRDFNVESSNISIDFDEGEPTLADDPVELNGREYRVFIGGTESINVSVDRNTLALTGTLIDDDIWTWELDDDELICTYTKTITGTPISCTSSGPANCGVIGIP
ncbi:hypothetical protein A3755_20475 [Oleiphilus sp. HI0085]|nr:hypothetical protein A3755_20475 [Oleiphilus sp. HI0085]